MKKFYLALSIFAMITAVLTGCTSDYKKDSEDIAHFVLATYNIRNDNQSDTNNGNGWYLATDDVWSSIEGNPDVRFKYQPKMYINLSSYKGMGRDRQRPGRSHCGLSGSCSLPDYLVAESKST